MVHCSFSFGNFYPLLFVTLHFTGCYSWLHTLPGIALKLNSLKESVIIIQQETFFCGFGGRPRSVFKTCAQQEDFDSHSCFMFLFFGFWFLRLTFIIFLTLSFRLFVLSHLFLFLKKYPGMLFTVQS